MTNELKVRAKRLRAAIKDTLGVPITIANSLELVAKEENYPNWDAATAAFSKRLKLSKKNSVSVPKEPEVIYFQGLRRSMLDSRDDQRNFLSSFSGVDRIVLIGGDSETQTWLQEYGYLTEVVPLGTIPPEGVRSFVFEPNTLPVTPSRERPLENRRDLERMYSMGSSGMCTEAFVSLMDLRGDDMWKGRAIAFLGSLFVPLVFLRDKGELLLSEDLILEYFELPILERFVWDQEDTWKGGIKRETGHFEKTYGKAWDRVIRPLQTFMVTTPGYDKAKFGAQEQKTLEQHGFITMQLARLFGTKGESPA